MEVKINREIRNYTEYMFFGLSLRQLIFSVLACGVAAGLYYLLRPYLDVETLSWVCVLGAFPFALLGFVRYKKYIEEAKAYFTRVGTELNSHFLRLGSKCVELDAAEKLRVLHDFYRAGRRRDFILTWRRR